MKLNTTTAGGTGLLIAPETVSEVGLIAWMAERFGGRPVRFEFGTTSYGMTDQHPMLWIYEVSPKKQSCDEGDKK